ncbi:MAG: S8/S53 family peptidase [Alphaproteobacteria bacterium]|nr:S8/S53 family peptidase [Alphaproteobacteria bacterium]
MPKNPLIGSERQPLPGARSIGKADPTERLEVTLVLRHRQHDALQERVRKIAAGDKSERHLTHEEYDQQFGADATDIQAVKQFANQHGLAVVEEHPGRRHVVLSGTVAQFNDAFGVDLQEFEHPGGSYRGRTGAIHLPDELHGVVTAVLGLDNRPQARPHFRTRPTHDNVQWHAAAAASASFTPTQLAALYGFPAGTGQGECIAIIELGGGYRPTDLQQYFSGLQVSQPRVLAASVDHGKNHPTGSGNGPDGEVMLDIEVAGAIAPGAKIVVYFAPNTDAGFLDAIAAAIHDTTNKPSVISISWGGPESNWTAQAMTAYDQAFQAAATMGITVCVAAGDGGSSDGVGDGADHVDFPASSPFALGCGGTNLEASGTSITQETVWNDGPNSGATGGGVSSFFALPPYQEGLDVTRTQGGTQVLAMRGVPDVAGDADPRTGYDVRVDGQTTVIGGTSAVAPLWAGLVALINAAKARRAGFINPHLYVNAPALRDITQGNNGSFAASTGWDACTGLGSPNGQKVADAV